MRAFTIALLAICVAWAGPESNASGARGDHARTAVSIGAPNEGHLDGGVKLEKKSYLRVVPYYADSHARWGVPSLVDLIDHAARHIAARYPGTVLGVGDLSLVHGGAVARHHSHESGRDADIGFYLTNSAGKPVLLDEFVPVQADGVVRGHAGVKFDDDRNWDLIEAILEDRYARVSQVFVAPHIRARLLRHAERIRVPRGIREHAAECLLQPRGAPLHDDHFHVRIACPPGEAGTCLEHAMAIPVHVAVPAHGSPIRQRAGTTTPPMPRVGALGTLRPPISTDPPSGSRVPSTTAPPISPGARGPTPRVPAARPTPLDVSRAPASPPVGGQADDSARPSDVDPDQPTADAPVAGSRLHEAAMSLAPGAWSWDGGTKRRAPQEDDRPFD